MTAWPRADVQATSDLINQNDDHPCLERLPNDVRELPPEYNHLVDVHDMAVNAHHLLSQAGVPEDPTFLDYRVSVLVQATHRLASTLSQIRDMHVPFNSLGSGVICAQCRIYYPCRTALLLEETHE